MGDCVEAVVTSIKLYTGPQGSRFQQDNICI